MTQLRSVTGRKAFSLKGTFTPLALRTFRRTRSTAQVDIIMTSGVACPAYEGRLKVAAKDNFNQIVSSFYVKDIKAKILRIAIYFMMKNSMDWYENTPHPDTLPRRRNLPSLDGRN